MYRIDLQIMPNARADRVRCYVVGASYSFYLTLALALSQQQCLRIQKKKILARKNNNTIRRIPTGNLWTQGSKNIFGPKKKQNQKPSKQTNIHWLGNVGTSVYALSKQFETNSQAQGHCRRDPRRLEGKQENPEDQLSNR